LNFSWRSISESRKSLTKNVLLTNARDKVARIWQEEIQENTQAIGVQESQVPLISFRLSTSLAPAQYASLIDLPNNSDDQNFVLHWFEEKELGIFKDTFIPSSGLVPIGTAPPTAAPLESASKSHGPITPLPKEWMSSDMQKLQNLFRDYPDVVFSMQNDGSFVLWGIQNLVTQPLRIPKAFAIIKISAALSHKSSINSFMNPIFMFSPYITEIASLSPLSQQSVSRPILDIVSVSNTGHIRIHRMKTAEFLFGHKTSKLNLEEHFWGHDFKDGSETTQIHEMTVSSKYAVTRKDEDILVSEITRIDDQVGTNP